MNSDLIATAAGWAEKERSEGRPGYSDLAVIANWDAKKHGPYNAEEVGRYASAVEERLKQYREEKKPKETPKEEPVKVNEKIKDFPKTEKFSVVDTIGVPHPFCITTIHVSFASDHRSGMLTEEAIQACEKNAGRPTCGVKGCNLTYEEHEQAVVVKCLVDDKEALREYLLSIKDLTVKNGLAGFVLLKGW